MASGNMFLTEYHRQLEAESKAKGAEKKSAPKAEKPKAKKTAPKK